MNVAAGDAADVPPGVVTATVTNPGPACAGLDRLILVAEVTVTAPAANTVESNLTAV